MALNTYRPGGPWPCPEAIDQRSKTQNHNTNAGVLRKSHQGANGHAPASQDEQACRDRMPGHADQIALDLFRSVPAGPGTEHEERCTGQSKEVIERDTDRDNYMDAYRAAEYGLIDTVLTPLPAKSSNGKK